NNNQAMMLCCLVASALHTSLISGYLALRGLRLSQVQGAPVHAGEMLSLRLTFKAGERRSRRGLSLRRGDTVVPFAVVVRELAEVPLDTTPRRRCWLPLGRMQV